MLSNFIPDEIPTVVKFFVAFQLITCIGLSIVLMTAFFSRNVSRHVTWYNFCAAWAMSGACYSILTLTGQQFSPRPSPGLCLFQATLIYAAPTLSASAALALVIHLWFNLHSMLCDDSATAKWKDIALVVVPYFMSSVILVISLVDGVLHPDRVEKSYSGTYCIITTGLSGTIVSSWVALVTFIAATLEFFIAHTLYRNWKAFRALGARSSQSLAIMIRVAVFTIFDILALCVSLVLLTDPNTSLHDIILAILAIAGLLVFGPQMDLARVWIFWTTIPINVEPSLPRSLEIG